MRLGGRRQDHLRGAGQHGQVAHPPWSGTSWGSWSALASNLSFTEPPVCYARASGIDCVASDAAKKGQFLRRNSNGTWAAPKSLGGAVTGVASCIAPSATTRTCFFQGSNRTLQRIYFNGTGWSAWQNLGGALYSAPSCVWFAGAETHCFAVGADGKLQQKRKGGGGWQPWASLGGALNLSRPACVAPSSTRLDCYGRGTSNQLSHIAYY